jgi:glycosyltransferase involved in cell wall biosynthesis
MRVVHIITCLDVGGAETMLTRLLLSAAHPGKDQFVISLKDVGPLGLQLQQQGVTVYSINMTASFAGLKAFFGLVFLLRRLKPDVVQTWMYHADLCGGLAAAMAGCRRIVWGIRGTFTPIGRPWTHRVMKLCARLSRFIPSKILCVAESSRQSHIAYGYCAKRMHVIGNGLDLAAFDQLTRQKVDFRQLGGWSSEQVLIGCVGRYHPDKGQDLFIQSAAKLLLRYPACRFVMIGRDCDSANQQLQSLIKQFALSDSILLLGERADIPSCLAGLDLFCLPSRTEGFPNVLAEAMAAGLPAVATDVGDVRRLVADTVLVVAPNDTAALTAAMTELLDMTREQRHQLAQNGRLRVERYCSIQAVRRQYEEFYQELLES